MALSGIELSAGIVVGTGSPIDAKYGPYPDLATAKSEVIPSFRYKGLTIGIETAGVITEYWWEDGLTDNDLVVKSSTSELVDDTTPQLSGDLDLNGHGISYASGLVITDALDEDDMSSDSSTAVPTQQSAKAYADNGDEKVSQTFTNVADTNFTIDFNSEDFTINRHITSITGNLTCTVSNAVSGSQFVIDVSVASGETNHELIFSGPSSPTIIPDFVNGTSDGLIFGGSSSAATKYTAIGWYNGTEWRINVIDWN